MISILIFQTILKAGEYSLAIGFLMQKIAAFHTGIHTHTRAVCGMCAIGLRAGLKNNQKQIKINLIFLFVLLVLLCAQRLCVENKFL